MKIAYRQEVVMTPVCNDCNHDARLHHGQEQRVGGCYFKGCKCKKRAPSLDEIYNPTGDE